MKYMKRRGLKLFAMAALVPMMAASAVSQSSPTAPPGSAVTMSANDQDTAKQVEQLVRKFLADVPKNDRKVFEDFFADDVIYTRSTGVTVAKADILKNIDARAASEPQATYEADDVTVHPYGNMAVINFRLVQHNGAQTNYFRNTGTFLKRSGKWQAVAWQATKVPQAGS
ncbi:MAG TPA: nuclear transport factor 2 family protein [Candidatus Limnocylindrales bacterium]|nr:nuclear transport factor 2 family protein [Candidatus Limnocylindrales bacterium]